MTTMNISVEQAEQPKPFDLLEKPWIPVLDLAGQEHEVSIRTLFADAQRYQRLSDPLETVNFAILRMLLAIFYRAYAKEQYADLDTALDLWQQLWDGDSLLTPEVANYLDQHADRFDLRHPTHPFGQVATLTTAKGEYKPVSIILPDVSGLFALRSADSLTAAEAARAVIHCQAYDFSGIKSGAVGDKRVKSGRGYPIGIGWSGWLGGITLHGSNLKQTLLLNFVAHRPELLSREAIDRDLPYWELDDLSAAAREEARFNRANPERTPAYGPVELLCWPQRRIRLFWDEQQVEELLICNGDPIGYAAQDGVELMTAWRYSDPQSRKAKRLVYMPKAATAGRALWRSLEGILVTSKPTSVKTNFADGGLTPSVKPAKTIEWFGTLWREDCLDEQQLDQVRVAEVSMEYGAQSSSFSNIITDSLAIGAKLYDPQRADLRDAARNAVELVDECFEALKRLKKNIHFAASGDWEVDTADVEDEFYHLVDSRYRSWLLSLTDFATAEAALNTWKDELRDFARDIGRRQISGYGPHIWAGRWYEARKTRITAGTALRRYENIIASLLAYSADNEERSGMEDVPTT
ncbi:type I-E CRISPR-associated protein Cse1/CasA [Corynebacterium choanae]|uniref:CRISPR-associated protein CasA/Cse1 n=1 Tax=Corynebacterium choanae TaxID=1862358 RepID=A0A3G6J7Z2_9CORY|nr:type I-E CRISPR-associated protein Cse1/CasA [Corynebacterium choanae]AZA12560.1 CRISPR-associated protein CasA/Cse1 [Corynebacterium choanae]